MEDKPNRPHWPIQRPRTQRAWTGLKELCAVQSKVEVVVGVDPLRKRDFVFDGKLLPAWSCEQCVGVVRGRSEWANA